MILCTGDLHLTMTPRDGYRLRLLRRLPELARRYKVKHVIILGDLTERKDNHSAELVNTIVDGLAALANEVGEVTVLRGNHDYTDIDNPFFGFLSHVHKVAFISHPETIDRDMFLPHTRDYQTDWRNLNFTGIKRIFTHNTFAGARGANDHPLDGIPLDALPNVPIISGDVHVPQKLGNVTYVGAPYTIDFGDAYPPRVVLLDDKGKTTSLKLQGPGKRLIQIRWTEQLLSEKFNDGDVVRVEYQLKPEDYANWAAIKARITDQFEHEDIWLDGVIPVIEGGVTATARRHHAPVSDEVLLKDYCKHRGIDADTTQTGVELL